MPLVMMAAGTLLPYAYMYHFTLLHVGQVLKSPGLCLHAPHQGLGLHVMKTHFLQSAHSSCQSRISCKGVCLGSTLHGRYHVTSSISDFLNRNHTDNWNNNNWYKNMIPRYSNTSFDTYFA